MTAPADVPPIDEVVVRVATSDDQDAIVALAAAALGWTPGEPHAALFRWKHLDNPFGASAMWVACDPDGSLLAFRAMLRWRFVRDGESIAAVRAVDTATRPDHQGRGLFRRLTLRSVDELTDEGCAFVFNTPNAQSRPGYLTMGWRELGRAQVGVRIASLGSIGRLARARVPAGKWSLDTSAGEPADAVLADADALVSLLSSRVPSPLMSTERSVAFLQWRYGAGPVRYRVAMRTSRIEDGIVIFRLRPRGAAVEATIADVLLPGDDPRATRQLIGSVLRTSGADYAIHAQQRLIDGTHVRLAGQGPIVTWRELNERQPPTLERWQLALGDLELF